MWKPFLSRAWPLVVFVAVLAACSGDEPSSVSEAQRQAVQAAESADQEDTQARSAAQTMARAAERDQAAESIEQPAGQDEEPPPAERSTEEEDAQASDPPSTEAAATPAQTASEEVEPADGEPAADLTDVPGVVLADVDVRVRPGLAWPAIDRLEVGASVVVLHGAGGWYRVRYGGELEGWIRSNAVDLGDIDERAVLQQPAPPILAKWRGVEYGVMGQSADATEVRLLRTDDEQSEIINAPRDEVRLLVEDVTLDDLPILIGDETVVFPGDDFRVGQGKILPKADQWMWLDDGSLLAHNETHVWHWHPEEQELEFLARPLGLASFSPRGRNLGIVTCGGDDSCHPYLDVTIMPLDGAPSVSLRSSLARDGQDGEFQELRLHSPWHNPSDLDWSPDGSSLLISLVPGGGVVRLPSVAFEVTGRITILHQTLDSWDVAEGCTPNPAPRDRHVFWSWESSGIVAMRILCEFEDGEWSGHLAVVDTNGEVIIRELVDWLSSGEPVATESEIDSLDRHDADRLGEDPYQLKGGTDRHAIVVAPDPRKLFILDRLDRQIRPISNNTSGIPAWAWDLLELGYWGWDLYWTLDHHLLIISRPNGTEVAAGLLIDLADATAELLEVGSVRTWACYPTGGWSPDGSIFQVEFEGSLASRQSGIEWIDGTATRARRIAQRQFMSSAGESVGILRAVTGLNFGLPSHIGGWNSDGRWFAIGGHQEATHCYVGA